MKNIVRAFVIALAVTGAVASAHTPKSATPVLTKNSAMPIPCCPPNDPNACGMGSY